MDQTDFEDFLAAIRSGDEHQAKELVRRYEPILRRIVRLRLHDPRLRRLVDSTDICQSILAKFFAKAAKGQFELHSEEQLRDLLVTMALNRLRDKARKVRRSGGGLPADWEPAAPDDTLERLADRDLIQQVRERLSEKERWVFEQRALERPWAEIAEETGERPATMRIRHARTIARIQQELGEGRTDER